MKVLFIEPPKDIWFVMGEYLPPPYGIIQLAAYLEREIKNVQLEILDCNAEKVDWKKMEERIANSNPDVVACASLATCNTYTVVKTLETAKRIAPKALTVTGGQHFTATAQDSLQLYPEIDVIIRNEGEQTLAELVKAHQNGAGFQNIVGISFRSGGKIIHNPLRSLIADLEDLPFPGYHLVKENMPKQLSDVSWFVQARCDDIIRNKDILPRLAKSGLSWVLLGVENSSPATLDYFKKGITPQDAKTAVRLLQDNGIMAHAMVIIGNRKETHQSILQLREFANGLDPDFLMFGILTPFPGTEVYAEAERNGWIEDRNWNNYDMIHAIMPTETLSTHQIQEELYGCYRDFYGSWSRRFRGLLSSNPMKRRTFRHMVEWGVLGKVKSMF